MRRYHPIPVLLLCLLLAGCSNIQAEMPQDQSDASSSAPAVSVPEPGDVSQSEEATQPEITPAYDYSQPAPASDPVEDSYFSDAAFVGDSRTDGLLIYGGMREGTNLTSNGLSIFRLKDKKVLDVEGEKRTLAEALSLKEYGKVYLSLGVNELGYYDDEGFYTAYCAAVDIIRSCQPHAVIYIQGLIPLNEDVIAAKGGRDYLRNDHLRVYNDLMRTVAQEKQVVFLDLYPEFAQEDGQLPAQASKDGVHLRADWCVEWMNYLRTHTVDFDTLYPEGAPQVSAPAGQTPEGASSAGAPAVLPESDEEA